MNKGIAIQNTDEPICALCEHPIELRGKVWHHTTTTPRHPAMPRRDWKDGIVTRPRLPRRDLKTRKPQ